MGAKRKLPIGIDDFAGATSEEWAAWREVAAAKILELVGDFPKPVDLTPDVEYSVPDGDLIRERVVFDSEQSMPRLRAKRL